MSRLMTGFALNYVIGTIGSFSLAIAGLVWLDYQIQALDRGIQPDDYSLAQWRDSIVERGGDLVQRGLVAVRLGGALNGYFPRSVSGWERRDWSPSYERALKKVHSFGAYSADQVALMNDPLRWAEENAAALAKSPYAKSQEPKAAVYVKGTSIVTLNAYYTKANPLNQSEQAIINARHYEFRQGKLKMSIGGHGFYALSGNGWQHELSGRGYRLQATLGDMLEIVVTTNAPLREVKALLEAVDYDGLGAAVGLSQEDVAVQALEQTLQLERQKQERQERARRDQEIIEHRLKSAKRRARGSGLEEVCISYNGKQYCAWVD